jgi:hypothetical protein
MKQLSFIYILSNEIFSKDILLINGTSEPNLIDHAKKLENDLKIPTPLSILSSWRTINLVNDLSSIEEKLTRFRVNPKYPYYKISYPQAIEIISKICPDFGYIYLLSNPSLKGIIKIGFSLRNVQERVLELNHTNLPTPFVIEKIFRAFNPQWIEKAIHVLLSSLRVNENREFFRIELTKAIELIETNFEKSFINDEENELSEKERIELAQKYFSDGLASKRNGNLSDAIIKIKRSAKLGYRNAIIYLKENNYHL